MAKQKQKSNRSIIYIVSGIALLIILLLAGKSMGWIGKSKDLDVEMTKAKRMSITERVSASGTVQPVIEVKLAPEVSGEIIELNVEDGDSVEMGEILVKIRPDVWVSQLERQEASLSQTQANAVASEASLSGSKAQFIRAELDYKRQEKLYGEKVISDADWQLAKQNFEVARNNLASAEQSLQASKYVIKSTEASVRESRESVRKTSVQAPMKGVVSKLSVKKGERVVGTATMTGTEMLRIADLNKMEVRVNVNENDIVRSHIGDSVIIDVDAYQNIEKKFKGLVTNIANTAKDKTSTDAITEFEVRILILRASYEDLIKKGNKFPFRPGMTASVEIITTVKPNVLSVPLAAVTTRDQKGNAKEEKKQNDDRNEHAVVKEDKTAKDKKSDRVVVFVNEKGVAKMVEVKTGISDYDNIEITSGLSDSAQVVTGPFLLVSKRLKEGDKIKQLVAKAGDKEKTAKKD